jgi:hypothetical protein
MILQFARHVRERAPAEIGQVEVRAEVFSSLNGRDPQRLIRNDVDLASLARRGLLGHADWIVPLKTPLN